MRDLLLLLLQALLHVPHIVCHPIARVGYGRCDGEAPSKAYIQHIWLEMEFQFRSMERQGTRLDHRSLLGQCKPNKFSAVM